jgi:hypothetical protein
MGRAAVRAVRAANIFVVLWWLVFGGGGGGGVEVR